MNFITNPVRASLFEPNIDSGGSKVPSKKQRSKWRIKKDHSPFVMTPNIKKPNDQYTPLVELLKKAPPQQVAAMGADVVSRLMSGHIGSALTAGAQGMMGLWAEKSSGNVIQSAGVSTDSADNGLDDFFSKNETTQPFVFRLKRLTRVIRDYVNGRGAGTQLAWEFGKVGLIVGGALAALGISIVTVGGFDDLLRATAIPAATFSSLTRFSIPTLIQSLTAPTPLAFSFLSAAHVIADKLMQHDQAQEFSKNTQLLTDQMKNRSKIKLKALRSELNKAVEQALQQHHDVLRKNSVDDVARTAFLKTYQQHWAHFFQRDPVKAEVVRAKIESLLSENPAIKSKAHHLWKKLHCWHVLNGLIKTLAKQPSQQHIRKVMCHIPRSLRKYLNVDKHQLPYALMIMRERLQEEVEKEIGVKLNRKTGQVFNAETREEVELDEVYIRARLDDYQKQMFLGGYLAGHDSPACKAFPELWAESEGRVHKVVQKRFLGQVRSLAGFLLNITARQMLSIKQDVAGSIDKSLRLEDMGLLKAILKQQLNFLKTTVGVFEGSA